MDKQALLAATTEITDDLMSCILYDAQALGELETTSEAAELLEATARTVSYAATKLQALAMRLRRKED